jgi:hypothetical protein
VVDAGWAVVRVRVPAAATLGGVAVSLERYDPLHDPDAVVCPYGCGRLTDDPYGGPCSDCWAELEMDRAPILGAL